MQLLHDQSGSFTQLGRSYYWLNRYLFVGIFNLFGGVRAQGLHNIPSSGPVIFAANHKSLTDPWLIYVVSPRPYHSMASSELFDIPLLGRYMTSLGAFAIKRGQTDLGGLARARQLLAAGSPILVFPEGRCSTDDSHLEFQKGVALLAVRDNVPIVPVAICGSRDILPIGSYLPQRLAGGVFIQFLPPLTREPQESVKTATERLSALAREQIASTYQQWRNSVACANDTLPL